MSSINQLLVSIWCIHQLWPQSGCLTLRKGFSCVLFTWFLGSVTNLDISYLSKRSHSQLYKDTVFVYEALQCSEYFRFFSMLQTAGAVTIYYFLLNKAHLHFSSYDRFYFVFNFIFTYIYIYIKERHQGNIRGNGKHKIIMVVHTNACLPAVVCDCLIIYNYWCWCVKTQHWGTLGNGLLI